MSLTAFAVMHALRRDEESAYADGFLVAAVAAVSRASLLFAFGTAFGTYHFCVPDRRAPKLRVLSHYLWATYRVQAEAVGGARLPLSAQTVLQKQLCANYKSH